LPFFDAYDQEVKQDMVINDSTGYLFGFDFMIVDEHNAAPVMAKYSSIRNALGKNLQYKPGGSVMDTSETFTYNGITNRPGFRVVMFAPDAVLTSKRK
jgi:hypothetical protein